MRSSSLPLETITWSPILNLNGLIACGSSASTVGSVDASPVDLTTGLKTSILTGGSSAGASFTTSTSLLAYSLNSERTKGCSLNRAFKILPRKYATNSYVVKFSSIIFKYSMCFPPRG